MNQKLAAELNRRAALEGIPRARIIEDMLWSVVFPAEPTPSAERARKDAERQTKKEEQYKKRSQEARWEKKIDDAKARWHQKYNGEIIKINFKINGEQTVELFGTRVELAADVRGMMMQIIEEVHEENQKKTV